MTTFAKRSLGLPLAALAATLAVGTHQACAQGFLEMLLNGGARKSEPQRGEPKRGEFPPAPKPAKPAAPARISAPTYNTYKATPLARVDFSALVAAPQNAAFEPKQAGTGFREALAGLDDYQLMAEPGIAKALIAYYAANPAFVWVSGGTANARARDVLRVLGDADSYGLAASDYFLDVPVAVDSREGAAARMKELIRFEMKLSARALRYVRDARNGRIDPNRISAYYDFPAKPIDLADVLATLSQALDVRAYLESRHPQNPEYQALRVELEALRASQEDEVVIDGKLLLKPGGSSAELPKLLELIGRDEELRAEFGELLERHRASETYDAELVPLIEAAQKKAGLGSDGVIGPRTVAALAGTPRADRLAKVRYALEELRWHPSDLGSPRVFINQPAFTASFIEGGEEKLNMRVVVGRTTNQTSFFYDEIEQVDFHPYWGVPQSILVNEMLPRLRTDPGYLDRSGYEVTDSRGKRVPSSSIDWSAYGAKVPYNVRQTPSEANALGELKIMFPNKHAIYMHDTPQKSFFQRDSRALSHGCVRLQDPRGMAAAVLGTSVDAIKERLKKGHATQRVPRKIPVYVAYFTAWPDMSGKVRYFNDVYGRDDRLRQALDATEAVRAPSI